MEQVSNEIRFALEMVAHERKIIEKFADEPTNENVASVTLEVNGVEHVVLIHDEDFKTLAELLLKFNSKERMRLEGKRMIESASDNRALSYVVGLGAYAVSLLAKVASFVLPTTLIYGKAV